jgi:hypothetical protein
MLDDEEWAELQGIWHGAKHELVDRDFDPGETARNSPVMTEAHRLMLAAYERLTGFRETNPAALWHHVASMYGPDCLECGKPLRTPQAQFCAACGRQAERSA